MLIPGNWPALLSHEYWVSWANLDKYVIRISYWTFFGHRRPPVQGHFLVVSRPLFIASTPCALLHNSDATKQGALLPPVPPVTRASIATPGLPCRLHFIPEMQKAI